MTGWSSGYVADIPYTYGFYRELTPAFLQFAAMVAGAQAPDAAEPLAYCELGCGQGVSANITAAANARMTVHAMDFNPTHIRGAQALAREAGLANIAFHEASFQEFIEKPDLPQFDIIGLHGVLSWISPDHAAQVVEFVRRRLANGGLVYVSYNALPGWAAGAPLRRLIAEHAARSSGSSLRRMDQALAFVDQLRSTGAGLFTATPWLDERLDTMKSQERAYLAHEYLNSEWHTFYHMDVAELLAGAKLSYAGSADLLAQIDEIHLKPDQVKLLQSIEDPILRETVRDCIIYVQFRKDIFIRGPLPLTPVQQNQIWADTRFVLSTPRADVRFKIKVGSNEVELRPQIYLPVCDALAEGPVTARQLLGHPKVAGLGWPELRSALNVLVATGQVQPCVRPEAEKAGRASAAAFNAAVVKRAEYSMDLGFLASPVTGGGVALGRFDQLILGAWRRKEADIPAFVWNTLKAQGHGVGRQGQVLQDEAEILKELAQQHQTFLDKRLPMLRQLGVA